MDRVCRMLQESKNMSAAAVKEDGSEDVDKVHGLTVDEKLFLHAVERGDTEGMRRYVELVKTSKTPVKGFNINCVDSLGRFALTLFFTFIVYVKPLSGVG